VQTITARLKAVPWSFYISELRIGRRKIFSRIRINEQLKLCQPRTLVRGAGFQTRENVPVYKFRALALVAGHPIPIPRDADDQANSSGLSHKPALTGFSQM
jgi:hypothetical protein